MILRKLERTYLNLGRVACVSYFSLFYSEGKRNENGGFTKCVWDMMDDG